MFITFPGSFSSSREEKDPNPKLGRDFSPDKLRCSTCCRGGIANPKFLCTFFWISPSGTFQTDPRVVKLVVGSASVERPHKLRLKQTHFNQYKAN